MAYYNGKVQQNMLMDKLIQLLTTAPTGSNEPYWKKVNSGNYTGDGIIIKSSGKNGADDIYIRFTPGTTNNHFFMSVLENYVPNNTTGIDGVITGESSKAIVSFHSLTAYDGKFPVEYTLSFDRNKVILALKGDKSVNGTVLTVLVWAGMPERLAPSEDKGNGAVSIACSRSASALSGSSGYTNVGVCRSLQDRGGEKNPYTNMVTIGKTLGRSKGWGDDILLPTIYLEDSNGTEGVRSIMDGVHPIYQDPLMPDFKEGDEIIKNSKRYIVLPVAHDTQNQAAFPINSFPSAWMAIEQLL